MTEKQKLAYWRGWGRVCESLGWTMAKGRLLADRKAHHGSMGSEADNVYGAVWIQAELRAGLANRAMALDDLRHGCHKVACGLDKSSRDVTNRELDRIFWLWRLLRDPDDLDAIVNWSHPENAMRRRMEWFLENRCAGSYVTSVCRNKFGTDDIYSLKPESLRQLFITIRNRPHALKPSAPTREPAPVAGCSYERPT